MTAAWTRKATAKALAIRVPGAILYDDGKQLMTPKGQLMTPKGYLPLVLVRDDDESGAETRVLVRVTDLKEPCLAELLEMAEQHFGYGQQGVLKVPCDA